MRLATALLLMIGFVFVVEAQDDKGATKFAGTWNVVERNGKKPINRKWVLADGKIVDHRGEKTRDGKYKIDSAKKTIDLIGEKAHFTAIYEWIEEGKKLKICGAEVPDGKKADEVRPKEIAAKKGVILFVLEKAK